MAEEFREYMNLKHLSRESMRQYLYYARSLESIGAVTQETINSFCVKHDNQVARAFIKNYLDCFQLQLTIPPFKRYPKDVMSDLGGYLSMDQIKSILSYTENDRDYMLFLVMFRCGRRITECLNLQVKHIKYDEGSIMFGILKKRREYIRLKAVDSEVLKALKNYIYNGRLENEDYLFTTYYKDKPMTRFNAHLRFRKAAEAAGIYQVGAKRPHTHHLRHSFAINFLKNTTSHFGLRIVQKQLEHSSLESTGVYLQFSDQDQKEQLEQAFVTKAKKV